MTKKELRNALENGATLRELFNLTNGDSCEIYKRDYWNGNPTDEIIYIADLTDWSGVDWDDVVKEEKDGVIDIVLDYCYDGNDFLHCCDDNSNVAMLIWKESNWCSPYTVWMDYLACSDPYDLMREADISLQEAQIFFK